MSEKHRGKDQYRRVRNQKTALAPVRPHGNPSISAELEETLPTIERLVLPGEKPVAERVIERRVRRQTFNGPLPHPEIFRQYGQVIPTAPERILKVFEEDSGHIRHLQSAALEAQKGDNRRIQWMAFSLIAGGYGMSALFAFMDKDALAAIILTTTIVGTVVGFLQNNKDSGQKSAEQEKPEDKETPPSAKDE